MSTHIVHASNIEVPPGFLRNHTLNALVICKYLPRFDAISIQQTRRMLILANHIAYLQSAGLWCPDRPRSLPMCGLYKTSLLDSADAMTTAQIRLFLLMKLHSKITASHMVKGKRLAPNTFCMQASFYVFAVFKRAPILCVILFHNRCSESLTPSREKMPCWLPNAFKVQ